MKKRIVFAIFIALMMILTSCGQSAPPFDPEADVEEMLQAAKGQTVSFYGWGGNSDLNTWVDTVFAKTVKEKYNITLKRVPMDIDQILAKLSSEKQAGKTDGSIDMIWINGENFYSAKENGLLFGSFTDKLSNFNRYIDVDKDANQYDCGFLIEGTEAPYGKAQFVFTADLAKTPQTPSDAEAFMAFVKQNKGKVTYPALPDFTGSAFVRTIIHDLVGYEELSVANPDKESVRPIIQPAIDYLKELNPYLWQEGRTFPATLAQLDNMFADGELVLTMNYDPYAVNLNMEKGIYTDSCRSFIFEKGTVGNTNFIAIAANSPHKAAAMIVINEMLTPQMQASKYEVVKLLPALDYDLLDTEEKALFDEVNIGEGALNQQDLLSRQIPELPANLWPIIEEIWLEEVVGT